MRPEPDDVNLWEIGGHRARARFRYIHWPLYRMWITRRYGLLILSVLFAGPYLPVALLCAAFEWVFETMSSIGRRIEEPVSVYRLVPDKPKEGGGP